MRRMCVDVFGGGGTPSAFFRSSAFFSPELFPPRETCSPGRQLAAISFSRAICRTASLLPSWSSLSPTSRRQFRLTPLCTTCRRKTASSSKPDSTSPHTHTLRDGGYMTKFPMCARVCASLLSMCLALFCRIERMLNCSDRSRFHLERTCFICLRLRLRLVPVRRTPTAPTTRRTPTAPTTRRPPTAPTTRRTPTVPTSDPHRHPKTLEPTSHA